MGVNINIYIIQCDSIDIPTYYGDILDILYITIIYSNMIAIYRYT
jgi:hypothetical protein